MNHKSGVSLGHEQKVTTNRSENILFIHGLSGSPLKTWSGMRSLVQGDPRLQKFRLEFYKYPTRLLRLPFTPPLPDLSKLADGLWSFIEETFDRDQRLSIVAHSLGGLIARQMIVNALKAGLALPIDRLALIAVPSTGATLANVATKISFLHPQLISLTKDHESLTKLNIDWLNLSVEDLIPVKYVIGGADRIVPHESSAPIQSKIMPSILIEADHRSIVLPSSRDDLRYKAVINFIVPRSEAKPTLEVRRTREPDPLFDFYSPEHEPFYVSRQFDAIMFEIVAQNHIWLTGDSGIGKSAILRRTVAMAGWKLHHINLGVYEAKNATTMFRGVCIELASIANDETALPSDADVASQFSFLKRVLKSLSIDQVLGIVVEEIPLDPTELGEFTVMVSKFLEVMDTDGVLYGQVRFLLSSRYAVSEKSASLNGKARERLQFLSVEPWKLPNIVDLVRMLSAATEKCMAPDEQDSLVKAARGSPRFVKLVFRRLRNGTATSLTVSQLCDLVESENVR